MANTPSVTCSASFKYQCTYATIPAGSSGHPTSIIGTGTHKPMLLSQSRPLQIINEGGNYITLQWLEVADHDNCGYQNPVAPCASGSGLIAYPDGIVLGGDQIIFTDVYVHGFGRFGVRTETMGSGTFTRFWSIGNAYGGLTVGNGESVSVTGTMTFNQPIIDWNGCVETLTNPGIENPLNYSNCYGQGVGGYGDGLAFGPSGNTNAGNWTITGPGSISFNTQDGFDILHGDANGNSQIDKMRFEGNAGQQIKSNSINMSLTNSIIIGDCGWWYQAAQSTPTWSSICRAGGDVLLFNVTNNGVQNIFNNTFMSNGNISLESKDVNSTGCNQSGGSGTQINEQNNIVLGGYDWGDDTTWNGSGGNKFTTYIYNDGNDGNGGGTCGNLTWNEDYNVVSWSDAKCVGAHDKCNTSPGFTGSLPIGASGGAANTYYQGQVAVTLVPLASNSAAIGAGVNGLTYWNTGTDYHNNNQTATNTMGALIYGSLAANGFTPCFFNSDCSSNMCTANVCSGSSGATTTGQWYGKLIGALN